MAKRMQDAKYLSYMYFIKSIDGRTIHISGLRIDTPFATGQKVKKGEVLGQVHYCYKKIPQPSICLTIDRGGKPDDPMTPFGLETTFIPSVKQKPKTVLTRAEATAGYQRVRIIERPESESETEEINKLTRKLIEQYCAENKISESVLYETNELDDARRMLYSYIERNRDIRGLCGSPSRIRKAISDNLYPF